MENEILIAILTKLVDDKIAQLPVVAGGRGPRGFPGQPGRDGRDFNFADYEETIRGWCKDFALKFEDLTDEQVANLRGPRGMDGRDGQSFLFEDHRDAIDGIIREYVGNIRDSLKLKFSDLGADDIEAIRGPRGRDGRDGRPGRDFDFEEHRAFFETLKLKFSDLTDSERETLRLHFSDLTEEEKSSLKLRFSDLAEDEVALLRGPRGPRGQRGGQGPDGKTGERGPRGLPGPQGMAGLSGAPGRDGKDGEDGRDGQDAPRIVAIDIEEYKDGEIAFLFSFSDGDVISTDRVKLPAPVNYYASAGGGGKGKVDYDTEVDKVSATVSYVGKVKPGVESSQPYWQIARLTNNSGDISVKYANGNAAFDKVWDSRASYDYGD